MTDTDPLAFLPPYIESIAQGVLGSRRTPSSPPVTEEDRRLARIHALALAKHWAQGNGRLSDDRIRERARDALVAWNYIKEFRRKERGA